MSSHFSPSIALSIWQFLVLLSYSHHIAGARGMQEKGEGDLTAALCYWEGNCGEDGAQLLWEVHSERWTGNSYELHQRKRRLEIGEKILQKRIVKCGNMAARGSGGSYLQGGIQHLKGQGPEQPDLVFQWFLLPFLAGQLARLVRRSK